MTEREAHLAAKIMELLGRIAVKRRKCNYCPAMLYFVRHRDGAIASYTDDGTNHWANCPNAETARRDREAAEAKKGRANQRSLIETSPIP